MSGKRRLFTEMTVFALFLGGVHYAYYAIQNNPNLVPKNQQTELFYVRWLKQNVPALKNIGLKEDPKEHS
uniref:Small integral membrane protein 26 n=1 Tax=Panagrellus redivivus TaxID=6233 RepID=A0A7E4V1J8_PANRE